MNESCPIYMSHVPYEWVMSYMYESYPIGHIYGRHAATATKNLHRRDPKGRNSQKSSAKSLYIVNGVLSWFSERFGSTRCWIRAKCHAKIWLSLLMARRCLSWLNLWILPRSETRISSKKAKVFGRVLYVHANVYTYTLHIHVCIPYTCS